MSLLAFWSSLGLVFMAELGDKTQLVALSLAGRFNVKVVLAGIFVATLLVHIVSVALGKCVGECLPQYWITFIAGVAFIIFGLWTVRGDCLDDDESPKCKVASPFMLVAVTFFLAELGDKTMLSTAQVAAIYKTHPVAVWLGSSLGMVVSDGLAVIVGVWFGKKLPERAIKIGASAIFFGFGLYSMISVASKIPIAAWAISLLTIAVLAMLFLRKTEAALPVQVDAVENESVLRK